MTAPTSARSRVKKLRALQDAEPGVYLSALVLHEAPSVLPAVVLPAVVPAVSAWALAEKKKDAKANATEGELVHA
jgi:hypothetical protein